MRECSTSSMSQKSHVMCHISSVKCHDFFFFSFSLDKVVELMGGGYVIIGASLSSFYEFTLLYPFFHFYPDIPLADTRVVFQHISHRPTNCQNFSLPPVLSLLWNIHQTFLVHIPPMIFSTRPYTTVQYSTVQNSRAQESKVKYYKV